MWNGLCVAVWLIVVVSGNVYQSSYMDACGLCWQGRDGYAALAQRTFDVFQRICGSRWNGAFAKEVPVLRDTWRVDVPVWDT